MKAWPIALATAAIVLAAVVGYLSFGRSAPPPAMPASSGAVATPDGSEITPP